MLSPKEQIFFNYFASNHRQITVSELLIKFKKLGDKDALFNLLCTLEELGLIVEDPQAQTWRISDYGKLMKGTSIERLIRA